MQKQTLKSHTVIFVSFSESSSLKLNLAYTQSNEGGRVSGGHVYKCVHLVHSIFKQFKVGVELFPILDFLSINDFILSPGDS